MFGLRRFPSFHTFPLSVSMTMTMQNMWFPVSFAGLLFSGCPWAPAVSKVYVISCQLSSVPVSLLIPSYLPIETNGDSVILSLHLIVLQSIRQKSHS